MSISVNSSTASSEPSEPRSSTGDRFPQQAGEPITEGRCDNGPISPHSARSFDHQQPPPQRVTSARDLIKDKKAQRRGISSESTLMAMVNGHQQGDSNLSRRKSQFYGEVFAYREPNVSARNRVHQFSVITVEVKTNVIVKDEYVFLADLSQQLSQRYHRPTSSIFVTLAHSACLLFAGTFDSAYILTVTALPSQIQPTTNKRNAALIQNFMVNALGVSPDRGVVRFVGIAEEYLATNGVTVLGEIENLQKTSSEDGRTESSRLSTIRSRGHRTSKAPDPAPGNRDGSGAKSSSPPFKYPPLPDIPTEKSHLDLKAEKVQKMGRRRSFLALFGK